MAVLLLRPSPCPTEVHLRGSAQEFKRLSFARFGRFVRLVWTFEDRMGIARRVGNIAHRRGGFGSDSDGQDCPPYAC